jgi:hypothetical protein
MEQIWINIGASLMQPVQENSDENGLIGLLNALARYRWGSFSWRSILKLKNGVPGI